MKDTYRTILKPSNQVLYKDKGSKFFGYALPFKSDKELKPLLESIKLKHPKAGHFCYAWRVGLKKKIYKLSDDGEPSNSAGQPIYGRILSHDLTNILIVVVRVFGGTKLGVGGLIRAYKTTADQALAASKIKVRTFNVKFSLVFEYAALDKVLRIIKEHKIEILEQEMELTCTFLVSVRESKAKKVASSFEALKNLRIYSV